MLVNLKETEKIQKERTGSLDGQPRVHVLNWQRIEISDEMRH